MSVFTLMVNSNVDDAKKVFIVATTSPNDANLRARPTNDYILSGITYDISDSATNEYKNVPTSKRTLTGHSGDGFNKNKDSFGKGGKSSTDITMLFLCGVRGNFGHWAKYTINARLYPMISSLPERMAMAPLGDEINRKTS